MSLPKLPLPDAIYIDANGHSARRYTEAQMLKLQADTVGAVLKVVYEKSTQFGKTGEVMWICVKFAVRHEISKHISEKIEGGIEP